MAAHPSEASAQTAFEEKKTENESTREPLKKPFAKDEYSGDRIKDLADKGGLIGAIGALILGIVLWTRSTDIGGLITGLVVTAVGIAASIILSIVIRSYGDMLNMTIEQMKIMKKLEERKAAELAFWGAPLKQESTDMPEQDEASQELSDGGDGSRENGEVQPVQDAPPDAGSGTAAKPGIVVDRVNKTVRYPSRDAMGEFCPICGRKLRREYYACFYCGCKLYFDDEDKPVGDKKTEELLRKLLSK